MNYSAAALITATSLPDISFKIPQVADWRKTTVRSTSSQVFYLVDISEEIRFSTPLGIRYFKKDGYYVSKFRINGLLVGSAERSYQEMISDMKSQFEHAWYFFAKEDDENLAKSGKLVKQWLIDRIIEEKNDGNKNQRY